MRSTIYIGKVMHARKVPVHHKFEYPLYMYAVDLDELPELDRSISWFGYNRIRPVAIHDKDYLLIEKDAGDIKSKLMRLLEKENLHIGITRIMLLTAARYFNHIFNPASFFYCYDAEGTLQTIVVEVNNTFKEQHVYILHEPLDQSGQYAGVFSAKKTFHVSPFYDVKGEYRFYFSELKDDLLVRIHYRRDDSLAFVAQLKAAGKPLTAKNLRATILKFPLTAVKTLPRIHWQAIKLFLKKVKLHPKPEPQHKHTVKKK